MSERIQLFQLFIRSSTRVKLKTLKSQKLCGFNCNSLTEIFISIKRAIILINNDRRCKEGKAKYM